MGLRAWCLGLALIGIQFAAGCGGRALEAPGSEQNSAGTPSYGAHASYAGSTPSYAGALPSQGGAPNYTAGAPNYYTAGAPNYAGAPSQGGAPNYAGASFGDAGAPNFAGAPPAHGGAPPTDQPWEVQQLERIRAGIVGTWVGDVTNPWNVPCQVRFTFTADGHYSAHDPTDDSCPVLYYGTNDDSPEKTYLIDDVTAAAEGVGMLEIYFGPGDTNEGAMKRIVLSADDQSLTFAVYKDVYGPLLFTLTRA